MSGPRGDTDAQRTVLVGLMSGTSLDGISAAVVRFRQSRDDAPARAAEPRVEMELLAFVERPYSEAERTRLAAALLGATPAEYTRLDFDLGGWLADAAIAAIAECGVARSDIAAIASHGHTVWHDPPHATWQFGQAAVIAERTGIDVISDFRARDVAAGGQGAPLVPMADAMLFAAPDHWRALQNLGGIGNVTIVPPFSHSADRLNSVRAFDTGPGVVVIDGVVRSLFPDRTFDEGGAIALRGTAIDAVVDRALEHPFFRAEPPRSTGRELFSGAYVERFVADCRAANPQCTPADIVATAVSFTARSIALAFARFVPEPVTELVLSGGGACNHALTTAIGKALPSLLSPLPSPLTVSGLGSLSLLSHESVAFAYLGLLHLQRRPGNIPSATGACGPRVLGTLTPGNS